MEEARPRLNILLVAEEGAGVEMLKTLERSDHRVAMILTSPPDAPGAAVWPYAEKSGHRLLPAKTVKDASFADTVRAEGIDLLLNVHSLYIIKGAILEAPRYGSFNLHPGPLPRYAGLNAPSWALYRGEARHGVTVHHMLAGIDTGPIAYQAIFDLQEKDTALSVSLRCVQEGLRLMEALLTTAAKDPTAIPKIEQDLAQREYFGRDIPEGGKLTWDRPAKDVARFIRAFYYHPFRSPWGYPKARLGDRELGIIKASATLEPADAPPGTVAAGAGNAVRVACADAWLTVTLVHEGGKNLPAAEALKPEDTLA